MREGFYIPGLNGVRALAFGLVFLAHAGLTFIPAGLGVTIFFFLSGFLITSLLRLEHEKAGRISLSAFYIRRTLRIFPPFYVTYALIGVLYYFGLAGGPTSMGTVISQLSYVSNYRAIYWSEADFPIGTNVLWSLAVEEHFYLLYPVLFSLGYSRLGRRGYAAAIICAGVLAWRCVLALVLHVPEARLFAATDTRIDSILYGCFLAVAMNPLFKKVDITRLKFGLLVGSFLAGLGVSFAFGRSAMPIRQAVGFSVQGVTMFPLFLLLAATPTSLIVRLLEWRSIRYMGELSYTLYLVHFSLILLFCDRLSAGPAITATLAFFAACLWALIIRGFVEKPIAGFRRRLLKTEG